MTKTYIKFFWLFLFIIGITACGKGPQYYREASEQYSKGVVLEMKERTNASTEENTPELTELYAAEGSPSGAWEIYFDQAYEKVNLALQSKPSLKKKNLLGNTLAIKALVEWQKEKYAAADKTALEAAKILENDNESGYESTRDLTIMKAMPGLVAIDAVYDTSQIFNSVDDDARMALTQLSSEDAALFFENKLKAHYNTFISGETSGPYAIQKSLEYIQQAKQYAGDNKRLEKYLILCQLSAHKTWRSVLVSSENSAKLAHLIPNRGPVDVWFNSNWTDYKKSRDEHLKMLEDTLAAGKHDDIYKFFKGIL